MSARRCGNTATNYFGRSPMATASRLSSSNESHETSHQTFNK
jgi:hypothetical protein